MDLTGLQAQFARVADSVSPAVVAISASCTPVDSDEALRSETLNPQKLDSILSKTTRTVGTGFFVGADGFILTNEHVICEAEQLWVTTDDRQVYPAIVIGSDPRADLAVLKIPRVNCPVVKFAKFGATRRGQWTIAIGNPYGLAAEGELAMSVGVVSATDRSLPKLSSKEGRLYSNLIQTTAEINPGNSGGPLFNLSGEVIGINTAVILPQKQTNGIGFAIPSSEWLMNQIDALKSGREVVYGYLGVTVSDPTLRDRNVAGIGRGAGGAKVDAIEPRSPADGTKLKLNDVIVSLNGREVPDSDSFIRQIGQTPVDRPSKVMVYRQGRGVELELTPRRRPMPQVAINRENQRMRWRGLTLSSLPQNWHGPAGETAPVGGLFVVGIDDADTGKKLGLKQGSIITSVAGKVVRSISELQQIIDSTPPEMLEVKTVETAAVATAQQ
ncbi:MAG TPA: trypsin-like peptidase domain-containing protein [Tepidisphaeraceae bacterium]|nr:trypsin-like peptidase domain-containing protein [Tepidisphaeraceae bacterium]